MKTDFKVPKGETNKMREREKIVRKKKKEPDPSSYLNSIRKMQQLYRQIYLANYYIEYLSEEKGRYDYRCKSSFGIRKVYFMVLQC